MGSDISVNLTLVMIHMEHRKALGKINTFRDINDLCYHIYILTRLCFLELITFAFFTEVF